MAIPKHEITGKHSKKRRKNNLLKTKGILKLKYELSVGLFSHLARRRGGSQPCDPSVIPPVRSQQSTILRYCSANLPLIAAKARSFTPSVVEADLQTTRNVVNNFDDEYIRQVESPKAIILNVMVHSEFQD